MIRGRMMKVKYLVLFCLLFFQLLFASDLNTTIRDKNCTDEQDHQALIVLKKRVETLEKELALCKQVKPVTSKVLMSKKEITQKAHKRGKTFSITADTPKTLSAYYSAHPKTVEAISMLLEAHGFILLSKEKIFPGKTVISFTNEQLKTTNSFLSVLHLLVNENKEIRVQNPSYFAAAFLQDKYHYGDFKTTLEALNSTLGGMHEVKERYALSGLAEYHFMIGMPNLEDTVVLARGEDLRTKIEDENSSQYISFILNLPNGATLVGHKLQEKTYAYLQKINSQDNALIFPYEVLITQGKAVMLSPKYYLALSLPLLSMTDFLQITSAPEEIENDIKRAYDQKTP